MKNSLRFCLLGKGQINRPKLGLRDLRESEGEREREREDFTLIKTYPKHDSAKSFSFFSSCQS